MSKLILCGTPIGNLEDITLRALRVLGEADVIACEDTRRARKLLSHHGIAAPTLVVFNEANERRKAHDIVQTIKQGRDVVLISDAGMPGLSDPGYRLVRACIDAGLEVEVVPGPTASVTALALSGLPPARFVYEGFLPRKPGERRRRIEELAEERRTIVIFESPHRVAATLHDLAEVLGARPAAVARELTKMYEEVARASLMELAEWATEKHLRGEMVIVVGGAIHDHASAPAPAELARRARALMDDGVDRSVALARVARDAGVKKREVFDALVDEEKS